MTIMCYHIYAFYSLTNSSSYIHRAYILIGSSIRPVSLHSVRNLLFLFFFYNLFTSKLLDDRKTFLCTCILYIELILGDLDLQNRCVCHSTLWLGHKWLSEQLASNWHALCMLIYLFMSKLNAIHKLNGHINSCGGN